MKKKTKKKLRFSGQLKLIEESIPNSDKEFIIKYNALGVGVKEVLS